MLASELKSETESGEASAGDHYVVSIGETHELAALLIPNDVPISAQPSVY